VTSTGGGRGDIFTVAADSSSKAEMLVKGPAIPNDWSKDGQYLLYMDFRAGGGSPALGFFDFKTRTEKTYGPGAEAQFSPDGKWVAFTDAPGRDAMDGEVYVGPFPVPGGRVQISSHGGGQARWSSDGKELYYVTIDRKLMAVSVAAQGGKLVAGIPRMLFQTRITGARYALFQYAVSPDGRRFLINSWPPVGAAPLTVLMN
jgi:Tol biopolymer transport system component